MEDNLTLPRPMLYFACMPSARLHVPKELGHESTYHGESVIPVAGLGGKLPVIVEITVRISQPAVHVHMSDMTVKLHRVAVRDIGLHRRQEG